MSIGDNLEVVNLDQIPEPTEEEYRRASQQIALNGRSHEEIRSLLQALGFLPYPAIIRHRGSGVSRPHVRPGNGYFEQRRLAS